MIKDIDIRLLKVIHTLVVTGSGRETARILGQSQGNISYLLNKARDQIGARLFVRSRGGMQPCATAIALSEKYQQCISQEVSTAPQQSRRVININCNTLTEMALASGAVRRTRPASSFYPVFHAYDFDTGERSRKLRSGLIDIDIGNKLPDDNNIMAVKLFTSGMTLLRKASMTEDNPVFHAEQQSHCRHVVSAWAMDYYNTSIAGAVRTQAFLDARDVAVVSGSLINMVSLCAHSTSVMLVPSFYADMLETCFPVTCQKLPPELDIRYDGYLHYREQLKAEPQAIEFISELMSGMTQNINTET
ncbi:LysR family transcriptional regulator [Klebsiella aerogenes]